MKWLISQNKVSSAAWVSVYVPVSSRLPYKHSCDGEVYGVRKITLWLNLQMSVHKHLHHRDSTQNNISNAVHHVAVAYNEAMHFIPCVCLCVYVCVFALLHSSPAHQILVPVDLHSPSSPSSSLLPSLPPEHLIPALFFLDH